MAKRILSYATETSAKRAMKHPWRYLIQVAGRGGRTGYWSAAR